LVVRWRPVEDIEGLRWTIQADVDQAALEGKTVWRAGRMPRRFMKAKTRAVSGGVLEAGLEDTDIRTRRVVLVAMAAQVKVHEVLA